LQLREWRRAWHETELRPIRYGGPGAATPRTNQRFRPEERPPKFTVDGGKAPLRSIEILTDCVAETAFASVDMDFPQQNTRSHQLAFSVLCRKVARVEQNAQVKISGGPSEFTK
jgi:hypothetical protein